MDLSGYKTYYFDAQNGNDSNDGLSESTPQKTLSQIEAAAATASGSSPVRILLKKGCTFEGELELQGYNATAQKPLIVDSYGSGSGYPVIRGKGSDAQIGAIVSIKNDNVRFCNIEITDPKAYQGICVVPTKKGAFQNVVIEGCYIHDINFVWDYPTRSSQTDPTTIDVEKVWITNNRVVDVGKLGINVYNMCDNQPGFGYGYNRYAGDSCSANNEDKKRGRYSHKNVVCSGNYTECTGGDGSVLSGVENSLKEKNTSYYSNYLGRAGYCNAGIWVFGSRNVVMQYNEAAYTYLGGGDGEGFDIDDACRNIYFQYNYSHDNQGGGILVCNKITTLTQYNPDGSVKETLNQYGGWGDNYIRNNVFVNNGTDLNSQKSAFITIARQTDDLYVYNNTVILRTDVDDQSIITTQNKSADASCKNQFNTV